MPTNCCWGIHGRLTSERKASTFPSSLINHSTPAARALKRQAPFETVGQKQSSPVWPRTKKKKPLPLLSCTSLLSSRSSDGEDCLLLLERIPTVADLAISKTYPEPELLFVRHAASANLFSFCLWTCFDPTVRWQMRKLFYRKIKASEGFFWKKTRRRERSIWLQLEHGRKGETPAMRSPAHMPHISLCGFFNISSFRFHTEKDEGIGHQTLHLLEHPTGWQLADKKKVLQ